MRASDLWIRLSCAAATAYIDDMTVLTLNLQRFNRPISTHPQHQRPTTTLDTTTVIQASTADWWKAREPKLQF